MLKPETAKMASQDQLKPGSHLILLTIMSKPSHLTPSSLLSTHLLLPASMPHVRFWAPLPHQVHTKDITCLRALDLVWTFCLGGRTAGERSARYPPHAECQSALHTFAARSTTAHFRVCAFVFFHMSACFRSCLLPCHVHMFLCFFMKYCFSVCRLSCIETFVLCL